MTEPKTKVDFRIRKAAESDIDAITEIYNEAVRTTTATFDLEPRSLADRRQWFAAHDARHPVLVAVAEKRVVGWACISAWSDKRGYDDTAELTFYVHSKFRGRGIGRALNDAVITAGRRLRFHALIARVASESSESLHLMEQAGFFRVGTLREVGRKFDRVLDVHILQKILD